MKRCFVMFIFFVLMLLLAVLTENQDATILNDNIVAKEIANENQLTNELVLDEFVKND